MRIRLGPASALTLALSACAGSRRTIETAPAPAVAANVRCWTCATIPMDEDLRRALTARIEDLKVRSGACATYGFVLETSLQSGRIAVRPTMWRHEGRLVAGEATPGGDMSLAR